MATPQAVQPLSDLILYSSIAMQQGYSTREWQTRFFVHTGRKLRTTFERSSR